MNVFVNFNILNLGAKTLTPLLCHILNYACNHMFNQSSRGTEMAIRKTGSEESGAT